MTVLTSNTSILNKILTNFQIMTKVASFSIRAFSSTLKLITCFYLTFIMRVRASLALTTFSMDKFLTYSIGRQLLIIICLNCIRTHFRRITHSLIELVEIILILIITCCLLFILRCLVVLKIAVIRVHPFLIFIRDYQTIIVLTSQIIFKKCSPDCKP